MKKNSSLPGSQPNSKERVNSKGISNRQSIQSLNSIKTAFSNALTASVKEQISNSGLMKKKIITNPKKAKNIHKGLSMGGVMSQLGKTGTMQGLIKKHIPKPDLSELPDDCQTDQEFYTWNLTYCLEFMPSDWFFNPVAFVEDLDEAVVRPLREAQKNLDNNPYLTRLYSTVSPDEMTRDPFFAFNPELGDVSNIHQATGTGTCDQESGTISNVVITLENGETITIEGEVSPWGGTLAEDYAADEPAATPPSAASSSAASDRPSALPPPPPLARAAAADADARSSFL